MDLSRVRLHFSFPFLSHRSQGKASPLRISIPWGQAAGQARNLNGFDASAEGCNKEHQVSREVIHSLDSGNVDADSNPQKSEC